MRGREEWRQRLGRPIGSVTQKRQVEGSLDRFQRRIMGVKARILNALHAIVRNHDEHDPVVEVGRIATATSATPT